MKILRFNQNFNVFPMWLPLTNDLLGNFYIKLNYVQSFVYFLYVNYLTFNN